MTAVDPEMMPLYSGLPLELLIVIVLDELGVMFDEPVSPAAVKVKAPEVIPVMLLTVPIFNALPFTKVMPDVPMLAASVETLFDVLDRL